VLFFDEGRFGLQPIIGRYWGLKGKKQSVTVVTKYTFFYLYAGISPITGDSFILYLPWVNTAIMNLYLQYLAAAYADKKLLIFMDQAGWHKSKDLEVPTNIQIECLPAYSPELNPTEKIWQSLRRKVCRNRLFDSENDLMNALTATLREMSQTQFKQLCHCNYLLHYK
jgi:transposase